MLPLSGQRKGQAETFLAILFTRRYEVAELANLLQKNKADRRVTTSSQLPEILALLEKGMTRSEIGAELGLAINQVDHVLYRHRKLQKTAK